MTPRPASVGTPIAFVKGICLGYAKYGVDPAPALQKAQIPPSLLQQPDARVTPAQFEALSFVAMQELDDEALGWFSRRLPWGAYGLLCRASITSATLGLALRRWTRHHRILVDDILLTLDVDDGVAKISVREARDLGAFREFCLVTLLRYVLGYACWAVDFRIPLLRAEFPFSAPPHVDVYSKLFAENLRFDAPCASVCFDAAFLERALQRDEAALQKMLKRALPLTVLPYRRDQRLSTRVKMVMSMPKAELPAAQDLAEGFNISTRTLHRQLSKEGASLRDLQKKARMDRAKEGLARSNQPIKRVAHAAGFQNEKAFSRAFRQAMGETPSAYRKRMRHS
ncbi:helix-turn-helix domain-containing protein [Rhodoblastus acidophilus]|uniref:Helix-turn-helix domain-containing protein n=1 Tax=Rhodoblastus acidophilus TaxID=1074 RepID=A0A6N8DL88_RHOAC|nr:AraC family transcriptional regulator [Rhodoblastus acidophilus]MCW2275081.1 AraC-like DNA-binding protein [Rhodoblastus acidophilus]MTV31352.1 helix-turn-helix domain-containing protein [Rhodoblastus acidophilus]